MGFNESEYCGLTGLRYDKKRKTFFGTMQGGYPVFVQLVPRRDTFLFRLIAKLPADKTQAEIAEALEQWRMKHAGVAALKHQDRSLSAAVSCAGSDTERAAASVTAELVALAADLGLIPCCMSCGTEHGFSQYLLDGTGITVCEACKTHLQSNMQADTEKQAERTPHTGGLILGALIGAAVVFLLTVLPHFGISDVFSGSGLFNILTGYTGMIAGLFAMRRLGKKLTRSAAVLCCVLCLAGGCFGAVWQISRALADYNTECREQAETICEAAKIMQEKANGNSSEEILQAEAAFGASFRWDEVEPSLEWAEMVVSHRTTVSCLGAFPAYLTSSTFGSVLRRALARMLFFLLLSVGVGAVLTVPRMLKADSGEHQLLPPESA